MNILAIDTSGEDCGILILNENFKKPFVLVKEKINRGYSECLPSLLETALANSELTISAIDRFGVCIGPGSFTGIRIGISFAKGLSLVQKIPIVGLSTLEIFAKSINKEFEERPILAVVDSKQDEYFIQIFSKDNKIANEPYVATSKQIIDLKLENFTIVCSENSNLLSLTEINQITNINKINTEQKLKVIAQQSTIATEPFNNLTPIYLRAPDAKPQAKFAVERI